MGARFWLRWSLRDLRRRWPLVVAIGLVLAIGIGLFSGLGGLETWRVTSNDRSFAATRMHDVRLVIPEGGSVPVGTLAGAVADIPDPARVTGAEERLSVPTQVDASHDGETLLVPGRIVGGAVAPDVDTMWIRGGRGLRAGDAGRPVAVLQATFADVNGLPEAGTLRLPQGRTVRYVGVGTTPEWFYVIPEGIAALGGANRYAVLFTSLVTAQELAGVRGVNELVLRVAPGTDVAGVVADVRAAVAARAPGTGLDATLRADEQAVRLLYNDARGDQRLMDVFAWLLLAAATFAAFNLVSRVVEAQRREVGIGMALGVPDRLLALRPVLLGLQVAVLGVVLGIAVGYLAQWAFARLLDDLLPLPERVTPFPTSLFVQGAVLGVLLPLAATVYPVWRGLRVMPVEAIRTGARTATRSGLAPLLRHVRLPGRTMAQMPLRNVVRTPRRTALTAVAIAAVLGVMVSFFGMLDSFDRTLAVSADQTLGDTPDLVRADLAGPLPVAGPRVRAVLSDPTVAAAEPRLRITAAAVPAARGADPVPLLIEVVGAGDTLGLPDITGPGLGSQPDGIVVSTTAADDLGVGVGDPVTVTHPVRTADGSTGLAVDRLTVVGTHPNPIRSYAYAGPALAAAWGYAGLADTVLLTPAPAVSTDHLERALFALPGVATVQPAAEAIRIIQKEMDSFTGFLRIGELAALALALLIAANTAGIAAEERAREHATMMAYGLTSGAVLRTQMAESAILGVLGTILGIVIGLLLVGWELNVVLPETLPELGAVISISTQTVVAVVLLGVVAVALAPLATVRRLRRMDLPSTLRVVE